MTADNTFFDRGLQIGAAPMQGVDANVARDQAATKAADLHEEATQMNRAKALANDETAYQAGRNRGFDADNAALAAKAPMKSAAVQRAQAGAPAAPAAPAPGMGGMAGPSSGPMTPQAIDAAGSAPASAPTDGAAPTGTGLAAPGQAAAPAAPAMSDADSLRAQARQMLAKGKFDEATKLQGQATSADMQDSFEKGASMAEKPGVFDAAAALITQKDKSLTFYKDTHGRDMLVIAQPNGTAGPAVVIDARRRKLILGAQQMMEDGYVEAALGKFAQVSADLAAEVSSRNAQVTGVVAANNKTSHEEQDDDAKTTIAAADMKKANAMADRNAIDRTKQSFGAPVNVIDKDGNAVVMQPTMVNGKLSFDKVNLPDGARFPKQAPDRKFTKTGDNAGVMTDATTGDILFKVEDGNPVPAEKDDFAGKKGEAKQADWENQGVLRGVVQAKDGKMHYAFTSKDDPTGSPFSTPQEALAAGQKAKVATRKSTLPPVNAAPAATAAPAPAAPAPTAGLEGLGGRVLRGETSLGPIEGMGGRLMRGEVQ